ncbi:hypothetical protein BT63DRAFT_426562 [Microthyrium microscopicum]|uniref:Uncharacterized protein n=1 Tax=Microthyrium microscopicum TaxID=703497 RepID=A0A6A6U8T7_9PEZI|nr:hypothetical protein BT63DRAFT_426562 [Microthyrium microscopicum]
MPFRGSPEVSTLCYTLLFSRMIIGSSLGDYLDYDTTFICIGKSLVLVVFFETGWLWGFNNPNGS